MPSGAACDAQVVQATGNGHDRIGHAIGDIAELVLGNATDLYARNRMFHSYPHPRQAAVVSFLARLQLGIPGLFFG
jgi:hypothetical protein